MIDQPCLVVFISNLLSFGDVLHCFDGVSRVIGMASAL